MAPAFLTPVVTWQGRSTYHDRLQRTQAARKTSRFPTPCMTAVDGPRETGIRRVAAPAPRSSKLTPPKNFSWTKAWYPVLWEEDFDASRPHAFRVFDTPLVMFQDRLTKKYSVFLDVCPHRAVPLSEGRLVEKEEKGTLLECGYHGWTFDSNGTCVRIPQCAPEQPIPSRASCQRRFATAVKLGIVFVWFGDYNDADESLLPVPPFFKEHPNAIVLRNQIRILPYSYESFMENVFDPSHVPWVHHNSGQGNRNLVNPTDEIEIYESDENTGAFTSRYKGRGLSNKFSFLPPTTISYSIVNPKIAFALTTMAVPICGEEQAVRTITFNAVVLSGFRKNLIQLSPRWFEHTKANLILDGDLPLLRAQERWLTSNHSERGFPQSGGWRSYYFMGSNTMDKAVLKFRLWFDSTVASIPWIAPPHEKSSRPHEIRPRRAILDRFEQHTKHCCSCLRAFKALQRIRVVSLILAALSVVALTTLLIVKFALRNTGGTQAGLALVLLVALSVVGSVVSQRFVRKMTYTEESYNLSHAA